MSSWRYYEHDGTRWCWNVDPTFICPNAGITEYVAPEDGDGGAHVIARREDEIGEAADALGMDPIKLALILNRAHQSFKHDRERVDGKLTDRCKACGAKMRREGFRAWIERFVPENERTEAERTSTRIGSRLFGSSDTTWRREGFRWYDTKKEATGWALDEYKVAKALKASAS
jgi:hypothetical protein